MQFVHLYGKYRGIDDKGQVPGIFTIYGKSYKELKKVLLHQLSDLAWGKSGNPDYGSFLHFLGNVVIFHC